MHGYPRYTRNIDIWVDMAPDNAENMVKALEQFGFGSLNLQAAGFLVPDQIRQLGYSPRRIDLIDLENLKKNKWASGRLQDLAHLENL